MLRSLTQAILAVFCTSLLVSQSFSQDFDERFSDWPIDLKIEGRLVLARSMKDLFPIGELVSRSDREGAVALLCDQADAKQLKEQYAKVFSEVTVVHSLREWEKLSEDQVLAWHHSQHFQTKHQYLDRHARLIRKQIESGKTVVVIGGAARWCGRCYLANSQSHPTIASGINLLPDCVLQVDYQAERDQARLLSVLASQKHSVGIGLEAQTALLLSGRKVIVAGEGKATFLLTSNDRTPNRIESIAPRSRTRRQRATEYLVDLTEWRRDAIDRSLEQFPAADPRTPNVEEGTLFIVGGGGMPQGLMDDFVEAAGGKEGAKLVYVPCSEEDSVGETQRMVQLWERMGVKSASFIHTKDRNKANKDESFYAPLKDATGIWFGGGRQWNFSDSYYGTKTHALMKEVLARGGAIGGSSAGASIQARYLCRATPIENFRPMAPGYERGGLGFISGVAIDQHFAQRRRFKDMTSLVNRYPQLLGIGIDEATAIVVRKSRADVVGRGKVHFYNRDLPVYPDQPDFLALEAGESYDLAERKQLIVEPSGNGIAEEEVDAN
ncbi:MAG: Type 1 glutamine amidotransferase-like domain-containing protein [Planctomycetota bacterium]